MNLKPIASNMTELVLNDGTQVLFSYQTPVACWINGQFYKTAKKWSNTTTRHINKWAHCAVSQPQEYFDNLVKGGLIMSNKYNGWSNYETWNANLWIDNDWRMSEQIALITCDFFSSFEDLDTITGLVAERINDLFLDMMPDIEAGFFSDVMNASFRGVNFWEIARHYVEAEAECIESFKSEEA